MNRILCLFVVTMLVAPATSALTQEESELPDGGLKYSPNNPGAFRTVEDAKAFAAKKRKEQYDKAKAKAIAKAKDRIKVMQDLAAGGDPQAAEDLAQADPKVPAAATSSASRAPAANGGKSSGKVDLSRCKPQKGRLSFNFDKAAINEVLDQISRIKCMNFILSDAVKGKNDITIVSRSPVTVGQAYAAFLSALEANGMALVPAGAFWKVVERKDSAKTTVPMYEVKDGVLTRMTPDEKASGEMPNSDANVTLLYEIKYAQKEIVQNLVRNLMSKNADLQTPAGNLFILTDSGSNILRIMEVLDKIDVEGTSNRLNTVTLKWADAQGMAQKLSDIFGVTPNKAKVAASTSRAVRRGKVPPRPGMPEAEVDTGDEEGGDITDTPIEKIIPDDRTNQLLVISSPKAFEKVLEVLRLLDVPGTEFGNGELKMWVVPLANSDAQKAASTLSSLASGASARPNNSAAKGGVKAKQAQKAASLFEGEVKVTADESTNSLVVVASARDFRALKSVIDKLDVRRPQVFVEAAIMEVGITQDRSVGLNAYASTPVPGLGSTPGIGIIANEGGRQLFQDSAKVVAGQQVLQELAASNRLDATNIQPVVDAATSISSLLGFLSFVGPSVEVIPGLSLPSVGAVLNLLQSNTNVDILSTPHIMTTDNEKAEISVGERVPVVRGIAPVSGAGALGFGGLQQVAYEDVKLKFSITPHVNSNGEVRIELEQEVSDLGGQVSVGNGLTQPIITNRNVKNTVVAKDQQTIAIAGLISDRKSDTESKIPFFGDIPIVGWLFKTWKDNKAKSNLLIVLTPYIVRDDEDFRKIYERKMAERKAFVEAYFSDGRIYNPYIDYDKKTGPLGSLVHTIDYEMEKLENGGKGHGEELIGPDTGVRTRSVGEGEGEGEGDQTHAVPPGPPETDEDGGGETAPPPPGGTSDSPPETPPDTSSPETPPPPPPEK